MLTKAMISHIKLGKSKEAGSGQGSMLCKSRIFKITQMKKKKKKTGTQTDQVPMTAPVNKVKQN